MIYDCLFEVEWRFQHFFMFSNGACTHVCHFSQQYKYDIRSEPLTAYLTQTNYSSLAYLLAGWLVVLGFNATLTAKVISLRSVTREHVFPGFLTPVLTQLFLPLLSHSCQQDFY